MSAPATSPLPEPLEALNAELARRDTVQSAHSRFYLKPSRATAEALGMALTAWSGLLGSTALAADANLIEIGRRTGLSWSTIADLLHNGWTYEELLNGPRPATPSSDLAPPCGAAHVAPPQQLNREETPCPTRPPMEPRPVTTTDVAGPTAKTTATPCT